MFNGLGALNEQLTQLTSALSLDNMQQQSEVKASATVEENVNDEYNADEAIPLTLNTSTDHAEEGPNFTADVANSEPNLHSLKGQVLANTVSEHQSKIVYLEQHVKDLDKTLAEKNELIDSLQRKAQNESTAIRCKEALYSQLEEKFRTLQLELNCLRSSSENADDAAPNKEIERLQNLVHTLEKDNHIQKELLEQSSRLPENSSPHEDCDRINTELRSEVQHERERCATLSRALNDSSGALHENEGRLTKALCQVSELEHEIQSARKELVAANDDHANAISKLENLVCTSNAKINSLMEENSNSSKALVESKSKLADLEKLLDNYQSVEHSMCAAEEKFNDEILALRKAVEEKDKEILQSDSKITTLTDKMKDLMQRYAELKSKSTTQAQHNQTTIAELTKCCNAKDSEILSFKMKMENIERTSSDTKLKATELADRYSEAQKEITRIHDTLQEKESLVLSTTTTIELLQKQVADTSTERNNLSTQLKELIESSNALEQAQRAKEREEATQHEQKLSDAMNLIVELKAELALASNRLIAETDAAGDLEGYKKRAQSALKKANTAASALSAENQQLQAVQQQNLLRIAELEQTMADTSENWAAELKTAHSTEAILRKEVALLKADISGLKQFTPEQKQQLQEDQLQDAEELKTDRIEHVIQPPSSCTGSDQEQSGDSAINKSIYSLDSGCEITQVGSTTSSNDRQIIYESFTDSKNTVNSGSHHQNCDNLGERATASTSTVLPPLPPTTESWAITIAARSKLHSTPDSPVHMRNSSLVEDAVIATDCEVSNTESIDAANIETIVPPSTDSALLLVNELHCQIDNLRKDIALRSIEAEASRQELQYEKEEKLKYKNRIEELVAFLERSKKLQDGPNSAVNMEYLKNCIYKYMASSSTSERKRLYPVISTILKLTNQEVQSIELALGLQEEEENEINQTINNIGSFASGLWGTATTLLSSASPESETFNPPSRGGSDLESTATSSTTSV